MTAGLKGLSCGAQPIASASFADAGRGLGIEAIGAPELQACRFGYGQWAA
jgi:hypothetical protein